MSGWFRKKVFFISSNGLSRQISQITIFTSELICTKKSNYVLMHWSLWSFWNKIKDW
jgi:hypothetical protein